MIGTLSACSFNALPMYFAIPEWLPLVRNHPPTDLAVSASPAISSSDSSGSSAKSLIAPVIDSRTCGRLSFQFFSMKVLPMVCERLIQTEEGREDATEGEVVPVQDDMGGTQSGTECPLRWAEASSRASRTQTGLIRTSTQPSHSRRGAFSESDQMSVPSGRAGEQITPLRITCVSLSLARSH
eukprot:137030-Rhodomonas_salina.2